MTCAVMGMLGSFEQGVLNSPCIESEADRGNTSGPLRMQTKPPRLGCDSRVLEDGQILKAQSKLSGYGSALVWKALKRIVDASGLSPQELLKTAVSDRA